LSLGAGNSTQVAFTVLPPEAGINLTVVVDPEDYVEESIESNNEMTWSMSSETDETDENWFQFHKDAENTGFYPGDAPDDSTLLWVSDYINAVGSSSPVIGNGTVYVNCGESDMNSGPAGDDNDALLGLDMYTGEVVENFGPGSGSTSYGSWLAPCYYEGNVSCGRDDSVNGGDTIVNGKRYSSSYRGTYYCTYESNGTEIWSFQVRGNYAQGTPVYSDGMVYLTSSIYFNTVNGGDLYCVDADTGELIWHLNTPREMDGSVSVYNDVLYVTTYNWYSYGDIYAIDKYDGTVLWRNTIQRTDSCPAVAYGNVYVSGGCPGYSLIQSYCFDAVTGETVWETVASGYGIGGWTASPVVADDKVYIGQIDSTMFSYSKIYAFDAYTGDEIWSSSGGATPAISEGILYTIGNDYRVYAYGSLAPVANFSANVTSGEAPLTVAFTDLSGPNVTGWQWDFDNDGEIDSTEQNPVYTFSSAGNYTVSLKVTNSGGNDTETKDAFIVVTEGNGVQEDWNPWNDPDSADGNLIANSEIQEAVIKWKSQSPLSNGHIVSNQDIQALVIKWKSQSPM
jgi:outer membrane protein assembly factor BamB